MSASPHTTPVPHTARLAGQGHPVTARASQPLLLEGETQLWWIENGALDLFICRLEAGEPVGALHPLGRREAGSLLWGLPSARAGADWGLVALGNSSCQVRALDAAPGLAGLDMPALTQALEDWLGFLLQPLGAARPLQAQPIADSAGASGSTIAPPPEHAVSVRPELVEGQCQHCQDWAATEPVVSSTEDSARTAASDLKDRANDDSAGGQEHAAGSLLQGEAGCWVELQHGQWHYLGLPGITLEPGAGPLPLPQQAWLTAASAGRLVRVNPPAAAAPLQAGCQQLIGRLWPALLARLEQALSQEDIRLARKESREGEYLGQALGQLAAILQPARGDTDAAFASAGSSSSAGDSKLLATCRRLSLHTGIQFATPPSRGGARPRDPLAEIAEASHTRLRQVALRGQWWRQDGLPLLAYRRAAAAQGKEGRAGAADAEAGSPTTARSPVALLPGPDGYRLALADGRPGARLSAEMAAGLEDFAWVFYRGFGANLLSVFDMLRFGSQGCGADFLRVLLMGLAIGLLGLLTPLATGLLFENVIPAADRGQLLQLSLALLAGTLAASMFELTRGYAMLRLEGRMDTAIQSAVWDRLLRLPTTFFRDYSAGDLAMRAYGINTIRQTLSGHVLQTLLAAVFSGFNLLLLFYYNPRLALVAVGLVACAVLVTLLAGGLRLRHERQLAGVEGRIYGQVLEFLSGIAKLRTSGAERRAFFNWATNYARQQQHLFRARLIGNLLQVFNSLFPALANLLIFATIAFWLSQEQRFSTGDFLAFNAAFGGFLAAMLAASSTMIAIIGIVPTYERARPILQSAPEIHAGQADPGTLSGDIQISHLSFRYSAAGPTILKDINLHIRPGEFVAIVGASGSGKSTLLRLLLGFERPTQGAIHYDRQDLAGLDLGALRRQLGVVLQNGQLLAGDIFTNIVGSAPLGHDEAWAAAAQAGIADDIRAMPMGMHTLVSEGGSTLSGGQRQRLMIARAIVRRPRILFFDEATSALDNQAQAMVSASLEQLRATRVVIAHRLSTVMHADRILVMAAGEIVESGTYTELLAADGLFADLARRQVI